MPIFETVLNGITVVGSIVGTRVDLAETYELHAAGKTRVIYETRRLDQVNEAFRDVLTATTPARLVFDFNGRSSSGSSDHDVVRQSRYDT